ncbi:S-adenosyl-L-methionine-dependent methyltransferase [Xylaria sp. FL1777]|nr:S-adenosyl-L-methionine-dependent methyltransferase [Xylaria sp. FL1777]
MRTEDSFVARARACRSHEDIQALYAEWANTYNSDLKTSAHDYVAPSIVAETAFKLSVQTNRTILDAGCGTGLVGVALAKRGATTIDGLDLSPHMLEVAEKSGVYQSVFLGDLTKEIAKPSQELVRVLKDDGHIVITVLEEIWLSGGFKAEVGKLEAEGVVNVLSTELRHYLKGKDKAYVLVLQKRAMT